MAPIFVLPLKLSTVLLLPEQRLTRLSVNLLRPIPFQKLHVKSLVQRQYHRSISSR